MSDATDASAATSTAEGNDAIPLTETATTVASTDTPSSSNPSATTFSTSTSPSQTATSSFNPYTLVPPFASETGSITLPPWATATDAPFRNPFEDQTSNGLTSGAKAGIGVGVTALILSIIAVALLILRMRKRELAMVAQAPPPYESPNHSQHDLAVLEHKAEKKGPPPPLALFPESGPSSPIIAHLATKSRDNRRKSNKSLRARRNSNLTPVSEEEDDSIYSSKLDLVEEQEPVPPLPQAPNTPRSEALHTLSGDSLTPTRDNFQLAFSPPPRIPTLAPEPFEYKFTSHRGSAGS